MSSAMRRLDSNVSRLARQAANTERPMQLLMVTSPMSAPSAVTSFTAYLRKRSKYAQILHTALHDVWEGDTHGGHCMNLRLEQRLGSSTNATLFSMASAHDSAADDWHSFRIAVSKSQSTYGSSSSSLSIDTIRNLCVLAEQCQHRTYIGLGKEDHKFRRDSSNGGSVLQTLAKQRVSLKTLLRKASKTPLKKPLWSKEQSVAMGLTIVSAFLELTPTDWVPDLMGSDEVFLVSPGASVDIQQLHVSAWFSSRSVVKHQSAKVAVDDRPKLLKLGIVLFEILLLQTVESCRRPDYTIPDECIFDMLTIDTYLRDPKRDMPACFQQALRFCLETWNKQAAEVDLVGITQQEMYTQVVIPFQQEVRKAGPP